MKAVYQEKGIVVVRPDEGGDFVIACMREHEARQHEAEMLRRRAAMVTKHVHVYGAAMGIEQQLGWMGVALACEQLAEALTLPPTVFAAEERRAS